MIALNSERHLYPITEPNEKNMIKTFLFTLLLLVLTGVKAQTYVYTDEHLSFDKLIFNVSNGHVIPGRMDLWSDAVLTASDNKIYKGFSTIGFDILYTLEDGKLYIGESTFSSDLLYTIKNGKVYKGDSTMMMDCLYTYDGITNKIFKRDSNFPLDAVLFLQGKMLNQEELFAVLFATEML